MFSKSLLIASIAALFTQIQASPVERDAGPTCSFVLTPSSITNTVGAATQLTYGFLVRMSNSDYTVSGDNTISYTVAPNPTVNADGTVSASTGFSVTDLTSAEISTVITGQWPGTWMWGGAAARTDNYDYYIDSASC